MLCVIDISTLNKTYLIWLNVARKAFSQILKPEEITGLQYNNLFKILIFCDY